ncbi:MAG: protein translocase subunit SecF [Candidatus Paceibacterota bacterium]
MNTPTNMIVIKYKNIFLAIGALIIAAAIAIISIFGLSFGIDFTGGSILEVSFVGDRPGITATEDAVAGVGIESVSVQPTGENGYIIRSSFLQEGQRSQVLTALADISGTSTEAATTSTSTASEGVTTIGNVTENRFASIGPTVGSELARLAIYGIIAVVLAIILFVTFAFRKVSKPISSWMYGSVAIAALIHDIMVPTAVFAILRVTIGAQVDLLFVMALLAILGFSVNDTIVVFDRIRENLHETYEKNRGESFADTVGKSLTQTYARSINTSLTTLTVLLFLYLLGGESTQLFALTLLVGVVAGTYSSIFIASPLLVKIREWQKNSD